MKAPLAPWRSPLSRALHRNRSVPQSRYFQLATTRQDGRPANRTVVFRGFLEGTNWLKVVTDTRSEKAPQINHSPWGEVCWYFPTTREQFRLLGSLILVLPDHPDPILKTTRQKSWQELSDAARTQFLWASPGQPRDAASFTNLPVPDPQLPPDHFALLLIDPQQVDHLELRGNPQNRWLYEYQDEAWTMQEINP